MSVSLLFAVVVLATIANATEAEQALIDATWSLSSWTLAVFVATLFSGTAVAIVAMVVGLPQITELRQKGAMEKEAHAKQIEKERAERTREVDIDIDSLKEYHFKNLIVHRNNLKREGGMAIYGLVEGTQIDRQADRVQDVFERASASILKGTIDYSEFKSKHQEWTLKAWVLSKDDIDDKRKKNPDAGRRFEELVKKLVADGGTLPEI